MSEVLEGAQQLSLEETSVSLSSSLVVEEDREEEEIERHFMDYVDPGYAYIVF